MERYQRNAHLTEEDKKLEELKRYKTIANYYMDNPSRMTVKNQQYLLNVINRKYEIEPFDPFSKSIRWRVFVQRVKKEKFWDNVLNAIKRIKC